MYTSTIFINTHKIAVQKLEVLQRCMFVSFALGEHQSG